MTKQKQAISFLIFSAMSEVMLDLYGNTTNLKHFDPLLLNKWKNIKPELEKLSKKVYTMFNEEEIKTAKHVLKGSGLKLILDEKNLNKSFSVKTKKGFEVLVDYDPRLGKVVDWQE